MCDFFDGDTYEPEIETTPNIEFQLNKYNKDEPLFQNCISEKALFATSKTIENIKTLYEHNIDIPMLIYGKQGIGKLTSIIGLIQYLPCYLPDYKNEDIHKKINNIQYFKILDAEFNKILYYENIYYINLEVLNNNNEITEYLKYIYQLAKSSNIKTFNDLDSLDSLDDIKQNDKLKKQNDKKIIIITHIDKCNKEIQRYIAFMLEKMSNCVSYILTTYSTNIIDKKIMSLCSQIHFNNLEESAFIKIFKINFKKILENENYTLNTAILKQFYQIYVSNRYNIGNTIAQIKYNITAQGLEFLKDKTNKISLLSKISANFIKKKLVLSTVVSALEIRKFLYILLSLNIKLINFVKEVVKQLNNSKLNNHIKIIIIEKASIMSAELIKSNKEVVIIESFFYDIINTIYSDIGKNIIKNNDNI